MAIQGRVRAGVIVLDEPLCLPDDTVVDVIPRCDGEDEHPSASRQRLLDEIKRIAALPVEGNADPFSGVDHDRTLYGAP